MAKESSFQPAPELETKPSKINLTIQEKIDELKSVSSDVLNLLSNFGIAALFLDKAFRIRRYTPALSQLMSLSPSDIGRPIEEILLHFTDDALLDDAHRVLVNLTPLAKEVQADEGGWHLLPEATEPWKRSRNSSRPPTTNWRASAIPFPMTCGRRCGPSMGTAG